MLLANAKTVLFALKQQTTDGKHRQKWRSGNHDHLVTSAIRFCRKLDAKSPYGEHEG